MTSPNSGDDKRKRVPFTSIDFSDTRANIDGYAKDWFFLVHKAFKPALDISFSETIDANKTNILRDAEAKNRGLDSFAALKESLKINGIERKDSEEYQKIIEYVVKYQKETEGNPSMYAFRETDSLESRCGNWHVQVTQAIPRSNKKPGDVGFQLCRRRAPTDGYIWERSTWHNTTQADFVDLLRHGVSNVINLVDHSGI